jgi:hypothetical protein
MALADDDDRDTNRGWASAPPRGVSRRDALSLATASLAASCLPISASAAEGMDTSSIGHVRSKRMSFIKVGDENSTPSRSITRIMAQARRSSSFTVGL